MSEVKRGGWKKTIDLVGWPPFGRLTAIERAGKDARNNVLWRCKCSCGNECVVSGYHLRKGSIQSCGCLRRETTIKRSTKHGYRKRADKHPEYEAWQAIKRRCDGKNLPHYDRYGGRGITVCMRWRADFEAFYDDLGPRPPGDYSIDRIDNDGNYSCGKCEECLASGWPANCRWATDIEQARNTSASKTLTYNGEKISPAELAERFAIKSNTLRKRLGRGMPIELALKTPLRR